MKWMYAVCVASWLGLDSGFWKALAAVGVIVVVMNAAAWGMKPRAEASRPKEEKGEKS